MKFEFAYETVLEHRKILEDLAQKDFVEAAKLVDEAMAELNSFYQSIDDSRNRIGQLEQSGGSHAEMMKQMGEFILGQHIRIDRSRVKIRELLQMKEHKQAILIEAAREVKKFEKLKEKQQAEFRKAKRKKEQRQLDDMVTMRFKRGQE